MVVNCSKNYSLGKSLVARTHNTQYINREHYFYTGHTGVEHSLH